MATIVFSGGSANAMLAINDLQVTAIPEPNAGVLLLGTAAVLLRRTRLKEKPGALQKPLASSAVYQSSNT
jgi:hypothetical protein